MLRLWSSGSADDLSIAPASDDGDHWLAGTMQCFARVALATVAASSALAAQINATLPRDDIPPAGANLFGQPEEDFLILGPAPETMTFVVPAPWQWEQHEIVPPPPPFVDEDYLPDALGLLVPRSRVARIRYVPSGADEFVAPPGPSMIEEESWLPPPVEPIPMLVPAPAGWTVDEVPTPPPPCADDDPGVSASGVWPQLCASTTGAPPARVAIVPPWIGALGLDDIVPPPTPTLSVDDSEDTAQTIPGAAVAVRQPGAFLVLPAWPSDPLDVPLAPVPFVCEDDSIPTVPTSPHAALRARAMRRVAIQAALGDAGAIWLSGIVPPPTSPTFVVTTGPQTFIELTSETSESPTFATGPMSQQIERVQNETGKPIAGYFDDTDVALVAAAPPGSTCVVVGTRTDTGEILVAASPVALSWPVVQGRTRVGFSYAPAAGDWATVCTMRLRFLITRQDGTPVDVPDTDFFTFYLRIIPQ